MAETSTASALKKQTTSPDNKNRPLKTSHPGFDMHTADQTSSKKRVQMQQGDASTTLRCAMVVSGGIVGLMVALFATVLFLHFPK